jgi:hypothetical protein
LVDLGVELYEMKPYAASRELCIARPATSKARLALHGKAAVFDRRRCSSDRSTSTRAR